jgi:replication factor C subunit 3/5
LPHLLFCGPPGAGKKTRIMALLRAVFGPGAQRVSLISQSSMSSARCATRVHPDPPNPIVPPTLVLQLRLEHKTFEVGASNKKIDITTIASNYHIEINPGEAGYYDREVVTNVIKEMAQYHPLEASQKSFKVLLLLEVDRLSKNAQAALRRTMEKYSATCRLILCCNRYGPLCSVC